MITAIVYLITGAVLLFISYHIFLSMKRSKNPFFFYFFWAVFLYAISYLKGAFFVFGAVIYLNNSLLFWTDFLGRIIFCTGSAFLIQIPLYKYFPKNKNRLIFSYLVFAGGVLLMLYQITFPNRPFINAIGIVNWQADVIMGIGMAVLAVGSWVATSAVFFLEFLKNKAKSVKPLLMGLGFSLTVISGLFQDLARSVFGYIFFSTLFLLGFILILSGMFYEDEDD